MARIHASIDISVVIPSYNQEKTVAKSIESVLNQRTKLKYEIIVVDSSNNDTFAILKKYIPQIEVIHRNKKTYCGAARNIGIKKAKGKIIAFTDTDCFVDEGWLNNIYEAHKKYDVVGGRILNGNPQNIFGWGLFLMEFGQYTGAKDKIVKNMAGCNISYKKKIFGKYGHFLALPSGEDYIFNLKLKEKIFYSAKIIANHINRTNPWTLAKHSFKLGLWDAVGRKNADLPGRFLFKYKFLIPLILVYRFFIIGKRALQSNYSCIFLLASPFVFIDLFAWTLGFFKGSFVNT